MKTLLIVSFLFLTGCGILGQNNDITGSNDIDPTLRYQLDNYTASAQMQGASISLPTYLSIQLVPQFDTPNQIGVCKLKRSSTGTVVAEVKFLKSAWDAFSELDRRILAFHELGHCVQFREHLNDYSTISGYTVAKSIMNQYSLGSLFRNQGISSSVLSGMMSYYEKELFFPETGAPSNRSIISKTDSEEYAIPNSPTNEVITVETVEFKTNADSSCN